MSYAASQKYQLYKVFLFEFTASSLYCLQEPAENHKSDGQVLKQTLFPRTLSWAKCYSDAVISPSKRHNLEAKSQKSYQQKQMLKLLMPLQVMKSHSNKCCKLVLKSSQKIVRKGPQFAFVIHEHCQIFDIFS